MTETPIQPLSAAPHPAAPPPSPAAVVERGRRRHLVAVGLSLAVGVAAVAGIALRAGRGEPVTAVAAPDVPRADGSSIVYSQGFRERAGLRTVTAQRAELTPEIRVVGTVTFDPEHVAAVGTRIRGLVRKLAKIEGDRVKEGELLAEIDSAELGEAQAAVATTEAQVKAAEINARRERELSERKLSTAREAEVAEVVLAEHRALLAAARQKVSALGGATGGALGVYVLRAPLSGTVVERHISAGQSVDGNLVAYRVADLDHLWIELAVFEHGVDAIRKGDAVEIRPLADPERAIRGTVAHVGDALDPATRSAPVRVKIDNTGRKLRPGQAVTASIQASGPTRTALLVPGTAVTYVDGAPTVFVVTGDDRVTPTRVRLGGSNGASQEILEGLREGQVVVGEGVFALKSELYR